MSKKPQHQNSSLVQVGKVVGVHGIKGEIKILPYGECEKKPWKMLYLNKNGEQKEYAIKGLKPHKGVILVSLLGYDTRNSALELIGSEVLVDKSHLPELPEGEYYHFELLGMEVWTEDNIFLGIIDDIFSTGGNDVYAVKGSKGELLLPAIKDVVISVDVEKKRMTVRLMQGLIPEDEI